jgi:hypothetical protein
VIAASYVLPLKADRPAEDLDAYLAELSRWIEVIVVDGSPPEVFSANARRWGALTMAHVGVAPDLVTPMGKVGGVLTGLRLATHDVAVIADDDVRWTREQLAEAVRRLDGAAVLRPQNHFVPGRWHTRWDTGRILVARATGGDWPGTLVVDTAAVLQAGGYDGEALFENLELVRTLQATGGTELVALDLVVRRLPPTTRQFLSQRVRQAYDEWARPGRLVAGLAIIPLLVVTRAKALVPIVVGSIAVAEVGRRRAGGAKIFGRSAALWTPVWVLERSITSWLAVIDRALGGARYGTGRLRLSAHRPAELRRRAQAIRAAGKTARSAST